MIKIDQAFGMAFESDQAIIRKPLILIQTQANGGYKYPSWLSKKTGGAHGRF